MGTFKAVDIALIATGCSCLCRHCYADAKRRVADPINLDEAEEILDYFEPVLSKAEERLVDIYYDLFDHPRLPEMLRMLHRRDLYGYFRTLPTNGVGIAHNPEYRRFLRELKEMGSECLQLSFHGTEGSHDWFVRRRGAFRELLVAAEAGREAGLQPALFAFANKRNVEELPALGECLLRAGIFVRPDLPFGLMTWLPPAHNLRMESLLIDLDDYRRLKEDFGFRLPSTYRTEGEWRKEALHGDHVNFTWRRAESLSVGVLGNFDVTVGFGDRLLGNIRRDSLDVIVRAHNRHRAAEPRFLIHEEILQDGRSERLLRLAGEYGEPGGKKMYRVGAAVLDLWIRKMNQAKCR